MRMILANGRWRLWLIGVALVWLATRFHESGHGWGDDFALYVNQARSLVWGNSGDVVADMRFSVENSAYTTFSPVAYPWVFPALLMPVVAIFDIDWALLKVVPTIGFTITAISLLIVARRIGSRPNATLATALIALNPVLLGFTDSVLSDLVFSGIVLSTLHLLDRWVNDRPFATEARMAMAIGLIVSIAIHTRREGLALIPVLAVAQLVRSRRSTPLTSSDPRRKCSPSTVWAWTLGATGTIQLLLPAPILNSTGTSALDPSNIWSNVTWYVGQFAQLLGLSEGGDAPVELFGSRSVGQTVLLLLSVTAAFGVLDGVTGIVRDRPGREPHHAVALVFVSLIVLIAPFHEQRYLFTILPLFLLNVLHGTRVLGRLYRLERSVNWVVGALLLAGVIGNLGPTVRSLDYHREYEYTHWGPGHPAVTELFSAVRDLTDQRDVVVFFQARSMNLYTGRLAIQGNSESMVLRRGDWYAMERDSDYIQTPLTAERAAEMGLVSVWENERFVLWRVPPRN